MRGNLYNIIKRDIVFILISTMTLVSIPEMVIASADNCIYGDTMLHSEEEIRESGFEGIGEVEETEYVEYTEDSETIRDIEMASSYLNKYDEEMYEVDEEPAFTFPGDGSSSNPYLIYSRTHLEEIASADPFSGITYNKYFMLMDDIDLDGKEWIPIGGFGGTFLGNGHVINNMHIIGATEDSGFFSSISGTGIVDSLIMENVTIEVTDTAKQIYIGAVSGRSGNSNITNCEVRGTFDVTSSSTQTLYLGGIVGSIGASISYCINNAVMSISGRYQDVGGIVGNANEKHLSIFNCENNADIEYSAEYSHIGGIVGNAYCDISECINNGDIIGYSNGGYAAGIVSSISYGNVENCVNNGTIKAYKAAGIVNQQNSSSASYISKCSNFGKIIGQSAGAAGIVHSCICNLEELTNEGEIVDEQGGAAGIVYDSYSYGDVLIVKCVNKGSIITKATYGDGGGVANSVTGKGTVIKYCKNLGSISAGRYAAGIVVSNGGTSGTNTEISCCSNCGEIKGKYVAGIIGYNIFPVAIDNCYNSGLLICQNSNTSQFAAGIASEVNAKTDIKNCYSVSKVNKSEWKSCSAIAFFSYAYNSEEKSVVDSCVFNINNVNVVETGCSSDNVIVSSCVGTTDDKMKASDVYVAVGWDFENIWELGDDDYPYPVLREYVEQSWSGDSNNVHWEVTPEGVLNITGTGDWERDGHGEAPWTELSDKVKTANVTLTGATDLSFMFSKCINMSSVNLSGLDTKNVTNMSNMFHICGKLKAIDLSNFNTSNVTDMSGMFDSCGGLEDIDLSCLNTSKVTNMSEMFAWDKFTELDVSRLDTSSVTNMNKMFSCCHYIVSLDMSNWNLSNLTKADEMFSLCYRLENIYTPKNVGVDVNLLGSDKTFVDVDFNRYTSLPKGKVYSLKLWGPKTVDFDSSGTDYATQYYFKDEYFTTASEYKPELATLSLCYAMSAFGSSKDSKDINGDGKAEYYEYKYQNAEKFLQDNGFENIEVNDWYHKKPTADSIGVISGMKKLSDGSVLIAVAVRGAGYEKEWASNFKIGSSGEHVGFREAKEKVLSFLDTYTDCYLNDFITKNSVSGSVKIWITGYSRAAATSNLVAAEIDRGHTFANHLIGKDNMFAYTFETPAGAIEQNDPKNSRYNNIFNIINPADPVPYVAPAKLGFRRYGVDKYLPAAGISKDYNKYVSRVGDIFSSLAGKEAYKINDFSEKKLTVKYSFEDGKYDLADGFSFIVNVDNGLPQGAFLTRYINAISTDFLKSRHNLNVEYEDTIVEICKAYFGQSGKKQKAFQNEFIKTLKDEWPSFVKAYIYSSVSWEYNEKDAFRIVTSWMENALRKAGITDYDRYQVVEAGTDLCDLLLAIASNHPNYLTTAICNADSIGQGHYPELCLAWLKSMDRNFYDTRAVFSDGGYRLLSNNCDVNVYVKDSDNNEVARIVNNEPTLSEDSPISAVYTADGVKELMIPVDGEFTVSITAVSDDTVNCGIMEYNAETGEFTRNVNYFNIQMKAGDTISANIPSYSESEIGVSLPSGSSADYKLFDKNGLLIGADSELTGEVADESYNVSVTSNSDDGIAIVAGQGSYHYGNFAQVEAICDDDVEFLGWYDELNNCVSQEKIYRFPVTADIELEARFFAKGDILDEDVPEDKMIPNGLWVAGVESSRYEYNGKVITPSFRVYNKNKLLTLNKDYTVKYKNNVNAYVLTEEDAGFNYSKAPTIIVTGKGDYSGTIVKTFVINPIDISLNPDVFVSDMTVEADKRGKVQKLSPSVTIRLNGKEIGLKANKDIKYEYPSLDETTVDEVTGDTVIINRAYVDPGLYEIKVTGIGNYTGTITPNVKESIIDPISKKLVSKLSIKVGNATLKDSDYTVGDIAIPLEESVIVSDTKLPKDQQLLKGKYCVSKTEAIAASTDPAVINDGIHYVYYCLNNTTIGTAKIVFIGVKDNGYEGTVVKTYKVLGYSLKGFTLDGVNPSYVFKGRGIEPAGDTGVNSLPSESAFKVCKKTRNGEITRQLLKGDNYRVDYTNNINAGTATLIITGINNYSGVIKKTFKITAKPSTVEQCSIKADDIPTQIYMKNGVKPEVTVKDYDTNEILVLGKDYTVSYANNKKVHSGKASDDTKKNPAPKVVIKGIKNYSGTVTKLFEIKNSNLRTNNAKIMVSDVVFKDAPGQCKPAITIYDSDGAKLKPGTDYNSAIRYTYEEFTDLDGSAVESLEIKTKTGKTFGTVTREVGDEVQAIDIVPVNTHIKAEVTGKGFYAGNADEEDSVISASFRFAKNSISKMTGTVVAQTYTGKPIKPDYYNGDVKIYNKKELLAGGIDYEIVGYSNNVNKGTGKITIKGIGNYGGYKDITFKITQKTMSYTVLFDSNIDNAKAKFGDSVVMAGNMKNSIISTGTKLPKCGYKLTGPDKKVYTFVGWCTKQNPVDENDGKWYANQETFRLKGVVQLLFGKKQTLYAQWKE